jgi:hypothetical protein
VKASCQAFPKWRIFRALRGTSWALAAMAQCQMHSIIVRSVAEKWHVVAVVAVVACTKSL